MWELWGGEGTSACVSGDGGRGERENREDVRVPVVILVVDPAGAEGELFHVLEEFVAEVVDADQRSGLGVANVL